MNNIHRVLKTNYNVGNKSAKVSTGMGKTELIISASMLVT